MEPKPIRNLTPQMVAGGWITAPADLVANAGKWDLPIIGFVWDQNEGAYVPVTSDGSEGGILRILETEECEVVTTEGYERRIERQG